jgi:hypothetical protein
MNRSVFLIILWAFISYNCSERKIFNEGNFYKLTLISTGAWEWPGQTIDLDNKWNYKIQVESSSDSLKCFYVGTFSEKQSKEFCLLLSKIKFYKKNTSIKHIVIEDIPSYSLTITKKNMKKYEFGKYDKEELDLINFLLKLYESPH